MRIRTIVKRAVKYILFGTPVVNKISANVVTINHNDFLHGRIALITGGTSGIGKSIAEAFMRSGANVIITGRTQEKVYEVCKHLSQFGDGEALGIAMNNAQPSTFKEKFEEIRKLVKGKNIDILVNNAGIGGGDISNTSEEEFDMVINTNLKGTFFLSRLVGRYMKDNHIAGNILNIASSSSLRPACSAYTFSKWGLRGFTLGLAKTLAPYGITVNGLAPGPTATPMLNRDASDITFPKNPTGRYAMPEEIANMAVVLTSDMGRMIVGDVIYMTGGAGLITFDDIDYNI